MPSPCSQLYVHLVWTTWERLPLITPAVELVLCAALAAKCAELGAQCLAVGAVADHVHVLVRCHPSATVSELVGQMKGSSSHLINHEIPESGSFRWQAAHGAFSVSPAGVERVRRYIVNQKQHHREGSISPDVEQWDRRSPD
ncbi:MAG: IS200/IS605 family transposase [Anaerolineales bacterium]|nr:IS200/IS605 family transposase [Anaerolineales bacterium]